MAWTEDGTLGRVEQVVGLWFELTMGEPKKRMGRHASFEIELKGRV